MVVVEAVVAFFQGCSLRGAGALVIAWLFGAAAFAATISGRVYEEASAPPNQSYSSAEDAALNLQSVRVQCVGGYSADQQTDSAGAFSFVNVPDGGNCTLRRISDGTSTIAYKVPGAGGVAGPGAAGTTADNVINFPNVPAGGSANNLLAYERASDRLKSFVIGKYLTGPISTVDGSILGYVAGTKFPITLVCRDSASASGNVVFGPIDLMLAPSETFEIKPTATTPGVPADVFCTLTEGTFPATTATNYEYVAPTFPSNFTCSSSAPTSDNSFGGSKRLTAGGTSTFAPTPRGETCAGTFDVNNTIVDTDAGALIFGRVYSELSVPPNLVDNGSSVDLGIKDVSISAVCTDPVTNVVSNRGPVLTDSQGQYEFRVPPGNRCVVTETQPANYKNAYNGNPPEATASTGGTAGSTGNSSITVQVTGLQNVGGVNFAETPGAGTATLAVGKRYIESGRGILVTGDPTYFTTAPSITVTVTCSVTGLHSLTFTAPTTQGDTTTTINDPNVITGLAAGEVCGTFTETFTGQVLSGSYTFTGPTQFQDGGTYTALPLTELTMKFGANALRVDNTFVPPPNGTLTIRKVYEGDVSKVIAYPTVGVNLICVIDGDPTEQTFPVPLQPDPAGSGNLPLSFPVPPILACRVGDEVFIDGVVAAGYTIIGPTNVTPAGFVRIASNVETIFTVTNKVVLDTQVVTVNKTVTGAPSTGAPGAYAMSIACAAPTTGPFTGTVTLTGSAVTGATTISIPGGATDCLTTETSKPTAPTGYSWGSATLPASFATTAGGSNAVTVSNPLIAGAHTVTVTKTVTGAPSTGAPGAYAMSIACAAPNAGPFTGTVTLSGAATTGTTTVSIPAGATSCATTETSKATAPTGYSWGSATLPASFATTAGGNNAVTVTNPLNVAAADMQSSVSCVPTTPVIGGMVKCTVTCTNAGPNAAINAFCSVPNAAILPGAPSAVCPSSPSSALAVGAKLVCTIQFVATASAQTKVLGGSGATNDLDGGTAELAGNNGSAANVTPTAPLLEAQPIPTIGLTGMLAMMMMLVAVGLRRLRRH